jgi:hypothetical protein
MYNTDLPNRAELPSAGKLLRSTVIAALVAVGLLVAAVLPAEYGIDPTGIGSVLGLTQMGRIKTELVTEANAQEKPVTATSVETHATASAAATVAEPLHAPAENPTTATQRHTTTITLNPGQAAEIKLVMRKDASVTYEWSSEGGLVNYDTHGDPVNAPKGFYHGYGKGRNKAADAGVLRAAFDGKHGWFWRNRSGSAVTVMLKTNGDYEKIQRVI